MLPLRLTERIRFDGLWRHRDFRLYWQGSTVSAFGTAVTRLALPLIATLTLHASPFEIGLIAFAEEAPLLVLGLFAGVWVDRYRRLPMMRVTDLLRFVLLLTVPIAHWLGYLSVPLLVVFALGIGILSVLFEIAAQAMTTTLLQPKDFAEGNSKRYAGEAGAQIAGPGLGGALISLVGPAPALLIDSTTYLYSIACLRKMNFVEPEPQGSGGESLFKAVGHGLREVWVNPYLRSVSMASGALTFVFGIGVTMLVPFGSRTLGLSSGVIGIALSMFGVGALIGSIFAGRIINRFGLGRGLIVGLALDIPGLLLIACAFGSPSLAGIMFATGSFLTALFSPIYDINQFSLRQAVTPEPLRGRMVATTRVVIRGSAAMGALTGGIVAELLGLRGAMLVGALAPVLPILILLRSPVPTLTTMPEGPIKISSSQTGNEQR